MAKFVKAFVSLLLALFSQASFGDELFENAAAVLEMRCVQCHGAIAQKGDLDLHSAAGFAQGGESGAVMIG